MQERKNARKKRTDGWTDGRKDGQTDERMDKRTVGQADRQTDGRQTDRQTKPLKSSRFLEISRTNYREQISRLEIRELNLIIPVPVPENGNGKIKKLSSHRYKEQEVGKIRSLFFDLTIIIDY